MSPHTISLGSHITKESVKNSFIKSIEGINEFWIKAAYSIDSFVCLLISSILFFIFSNSEISVKTIVNNSLF